MSIQRLSIRADGDFIETNSSDTGTFVMYGDHIKELKSVTCELEKIKELAQRLLTQECFQKPSHGIWLELHNAVMSVKQPSPMREVGNILVDSFGSKP